MAEPAGPRRRVGTRVVVLDDDPTGTQCAADVDVLFGAAACRSVDPLPPAVYVLTNTRAVVEAEAVRTVRSVQAACTRPGSVDPVLVLRGDSTLRGHVVAELRALGLERAVGLLVPAYPAAGRITRAGVHLLRVDQRWVNVADTEFARDPVFGFTARRLPQWLAEVGHRGPVYGVPRARLLDAGAAAVRDALVTAAPGGVVVPDVETDADVDTVAAGFWAARRSGRTVVVRCAAPLAAALAGTPGRRLEPHAGPARVLVVCGSHTTAATTQLAALSAAGVWLRTVGRTDWQSGVDGPWVDRTVTALRTDLAAAGLAVVATERVRAAADGTLAHGARVMAALVAVVRRLVGMDAVDAVVTKGGITAAEVATHGLGGSSARVRGQVLTGVPLWEVRSASGRRLPQVVVPGNVGDAQTLRRAVAFLGAGA